jgi:TRAP-type uncharacterized transport system substrate-binding protein
VHGDRLTMTVLPTDGTPENARLLRDGRAQLGFISSGADVSFDGLRSLAVIERQFVHAIVPVGSAVTQLADLKGRRVSLGPADGAPYRFGLELRRFYQDRDKAFDFTIVETSAPLLQRDLLADLDAGRFDAAIRITPLHGANVQRPLASGRYRLLPIAEAEALAEFIPGLWSSTIPPGTYPGVDAALPTLVAKLMVVARGDVSVLTARRVLEAVYSDAFAKRAHIARLSEAGGQDVFGAPLHDGAVAFYRRNDPVSADRFEIAGFALALFGLVGGLRLSGRRNRRRVARLALTQRATADLATLAERAERAPDLATLDQLAVEAARLNRQAIRDAPRTGLRQADLDLIQRAHDECTQTVRRRKRAVPGNAPRSTGPIGAPAKAVVPEAPTPATPEEPDTTAE